MLPIKRLSLRLITVELPLRIIKRLRRLINKKLSGVTLIRTYVDYENYLTHQKVKTLDPVRIEKWLHDEWEVKLSGFREVFARNAEFVAGKRRALCLGARTGQEVAALRELGIDAVGIELVPFPPYTVEGDVHK